MCKYTRISMTSSNVSFLKQNVSQLNWNFFAIISCTTTQETDTFRHHRGQLQSLLKPFEHHWNTVPRGFTGGPQFVSSWCRKALASQPDIRLIAVFFPVWSLDWLSSFFLFRLEMRRGRWRFFLLRFRIKLFFASQQSVENLPLKKGRILLRQYTQRNLFLILLKLNQNLVGNITLFRLLWHQMGFRWVPNQSKKCNYNQNLEWCIKILWEIYVCLFCSDLHL